MGLAFCKNGHFIFGIESFSKKGKGECRYCHSERSNKWNKENSEKRKSIANSYSQRNLIKRKEYSLRASKDLPDWYVANAIGLKIKDCPKELISLKRSQLILIREANNGTNKNCK